MNKLIACSSALLFATSAALASTAVDNVAVDNGTPPSGLPLTLQIQRIPSGSGVPAAGRTSGYDTAEYVNGGLYHVPNWLPFQPTAATIWPRVVAVKCKSKTGVWFCDGYAVNGILARGEDVYISPLLVADDPLPKMVAPVAVAQTPVSAEPVKKTILKKPRPSLCGPNGEKK